MVKVKTSQLPEGTWIEFTTATQVKHRYEKKYGWWFDGVEHITAEELDDFDEIGLDIEVISFAEPVKINENTSDGYHTFKELYEMRLLLTAGMFNEWGENAHEFPSYSNLVFKSKLHSDGSIPFDDPNWFIVVAETKESQISFHYEMQDWDLFYAVPEVSLPPKYDGHTAADVAVRLRKLMS